MLLIQTVPDLRVFVDGAPVAGLVNTKGGAILAYLALNGGAAARSRVAGLLWSDLSEQDAQNNLRFTLSRLRRQVPEAIGSSRGEVFLTPGIACRLDLDALRSDAPAVLIGLRVEDFLANLHPSNAEGFREWIGRVRNDLCQRYLDRIGDLADGLAGRGEAELAAQAYRRCLAIAPWTERFHRGLARLHADRGDTAGALAQLSACREVLRQELSVPPEPQTLELEAEMLLRRQCPGPPAGPSVGPSAGTSAGPDPSAEPRPTAGAATAAPVDPWAGTEADRPDFGMVAERTRLQELILSPASRIVTLLGPGGVGKTHLAGIIVRDLAPHFVDGMAVVRLDDVEPRGRGRGAAILLSRLAAALGLATVPGRELASLAEAAAGRRQVVLVDNFETIADAWPTLGAVSERVPGLKFVVTSRHQLGLPTEWIVRLEGLDWPRDGEWRPEHAAAPAVALLCRTAERLGLPVDPDRDGPDLLRICAALEGWPLGLILAASWLQAGSIADVARNLEDGTGLLAEPAPLRIAPRHLSSTAVLERSWQLLEADERAAFPALCIFAGRFTASDAAAVAGVAPPELAALAGKSLLRRDRDGSWSIHPLLRAFGLRHLQDDRNRCAAVEAAHAARSADALAAARRAFEAAGDPTAFDAARAMAGDHLAAFRRGCASPDRPGFDALVADLWLLHRASGWIEEGLMLLDEALSVPDRPAVARAQLLLWRSDALFQLGRMDAADESARGALAELGERTEIDTGAVGIGAGLGRLLLGLPHGRLPADRVGLASRAWNRIAQVRFFDGDRDGFVAATLHSATYRGAEAMPGNRGSSALLLNYTPFRFRADRLAREAEERLPCGDAFDRGWTHELLALHLLGRNRLTEARRHALSGADIFRRLGQRRNWSECQALAAYALFFTGDTAGAGAEMRRLQSDGARMRDASAEVWGALGALFAELAQEGRAPGFDAARARALALEVSDPNTDLLLHGNLAWRAASEQRFAEAAEHRHAFDLAFRRASMLSVYALNGFHSDIMALLAIARHGGRDMAGDARRVLARLRGLGATFPAALPFHARAREALKQLGV